MISRPPKRHEKSPSDFSESSASDALSQAMDPKQRLFYFTTT
jgi:hypothetical protein